MLFIKRQKMVDIIAINWTNIEEHRTFKADDFIGIANYGRNVYEVVGFKYYTVIEKNTLKDIFKK